MHIERLGEKTYLMPIARGEIEMSEDGSGRLETSVGSTDLRLDFPAKVVEEMSDEPFMAIITGAAELHIWVNDSLSISGLETVAVSTVEVSVLEMPKSRIVEVIPF